MAKKKLKLYLLLFHNYSGKYVSNACVPILAYGEPDKDEKCFAEMFTKCFIMGCMYNFKTELEYSSCCKLAPIWAEYCPTCGFRVKHEFNHRFASHVEKMWAKLFQGIGVDDLPQHLWEYLDSCGWEFCISCHENKPIYKIVRIESMHSYLSAENVVNYYDEVKKSF